MFNAWRFDGATFAGASGGVRVLFAAATFAAAATGAAAPVVDRAGSIEGLAFAEVHPGLTTYRAGVAEGSPTAAFEVGRPHDLLTVTLTAGAQVAVEPLRIAEGAALLDGGAAFDAAAIRYAFFADLEGHSELTASAWRVVAGAATFEGASDWGVSERRRIGASVEGWATAEAQAQEFVYRGGINTFEAGSDLQAYAIVNGVHESSVQGAAGASLESAGTRFAGGSVLAEVTAEFSVETYPWLGSEADGTATATLFATWWTYVHSQSTGATAGAGMDATAFVARAGAADLAGAADGEVIWSRRVEPSLVFAQGTAGTSATAWRIRHETVEVTSHGLASAYAYRVSFRESTFDARAAVELRAFVNFTNDAPDWRSMTVPAERRAMVVPYENRMMVVR